MIVSEGLTKIEVIKGNGYTMRIDVDYSLTGATELKAVYRDPNGGTGEIAGSQVGTENKISVTVPAETNAIDGPWVFHASILESGNTTATLSDPVRVISRDLYELPGV